MSDVKKGKLGMGLDALLGMQNFQNNSDKNSSNNMSVEIDLISPNESQPRKYFDSTEIMNLAESIRQNGVLQPIIVKKTQNGFMIIAGERRFRAAKLAGLTKIPANVVEADDQDVSVMSIIENIQRSDLGVIEEANAYLLLKNNFNLTQNEIATKVSKHRSHIANMMRIAESEDYVKDFVIENNISYGVLKIVCGRDDVFDLLNIVVNNNLSVRGLEEYLKTGIIEKKDTTIVTSNKRSVDEKPNREFLRKISDVEVFLNAKFGFGVEVKFDRKCQNKMKISIGNNSQLDEIITLIGDGQ